MTFTEQAAEAPGTANQLPLSGVFLPPPKRRAPPGWRGALSGTPLFEVPSHCPLP